MHNLAVKGRLCRCKIKRSIISITTARPVRAGRKRRGIDKNNDYLNSYATTTGQDGPHGEIIEEIGVFRGMWNSGRGAKRARAANDRITG